MKLLRNRRAQILLGLALLFVCGMTVYIILQQAKREPEPAITWETYKDQSYEFSLQFPEPWTLTSVTPDNGDVVASYVLTDPSTTTAHEVPKVLAAVHVNTRPYIQVVNRVESDLLAVSGETVTIKTSDGKEIQGTRYRGNAELLSNPMDATVIPLADKTLVIYLLSTNNIYSDVLSRVASTITIN